MRMEDSHHGNVVRVNVYVYKLHSEKNDESR